MFPFVIHSDAIAKRERDLSIIIPNNGSTFGWLRAFQVTTSLQNLCNCKDQLREECFVTGTDTRNLLKVARRVNPQDLDRNLAAIVFALPNVSVSTVIQRSAMRSIVTKWNFQ